MDQAQYRIWQEPLSHSLPGLVHPHACPFPPFSASPPQNTSTLLGAAFSWQYTQYFSHWHKRPATMHAILYRSAFSTRPSQRCFLALSPQPLPGQCAGDRHIPGGIVTTNRNSYLSSSCIEWFLGEGKATDGDCCFGNLEIATST